MKELIGKTVQFINEHGNTEFAKVEDVFENADGSFNIICDNYKKETISFDVEQKSMENILSKSLKLLKDANVLIELIKKRRIEKDNKFLIELSETTPFDLYELSTCKEIYKLSNDELKQRATSAIKFGVSISHYCLIIKEFQDNIEKS